MRKHNYKKIVGRILLVSALIAFIYLISTIDKEILENTASRLGWFGPIFLGLVIIATQVFAPLSGSAFIFVGIRLYGYESILILFYCVSMISATASFFIARRWGRKVVIKLVGKKTMLEIDEIAHIHERTLLVIGRTLGYYFFDYISYALGLTKISFKKYISYTAVLTLIPMTVLYFVFKELDFDNFKSTMIFYFSIVLTGLLFAYIFWKIVKKKKHSLHNKDHLHHEEK